MKKLCCDWNNAENSINFTSATFLNVTKSARKADLLFDKNKLITWEEKTEKKNQQQLTQGMIGKEKVL